MDDIKSPAHLDILLDEAMPNRGDVATFTLRNMIECMWNVTYDGFEHIYMDPFACPPNRTALEYLKHGTQMAMPELDARVVKALSINLKTYFKWKTGLIKKLYILNGIAHDYVNILDYLDEDNEILSKEKILELPISTANTFVSTRKNLCLDFKEAVKAKAQQDFEKAQALIELEEIMALGLEHTMTYRLLLRCVLPLLSYIHMVKTRLHHHKAHTDNPVFSIPDIPESVAQLDYANILMLAFHPQIKTADGVHPALYPRYLQAALTMVLESMKAARHQMSCLGLWYAKHPEEQKDYKGKLFPLEKIESAEGPSMAPVDTIGIEICADMVEGIVDHLTVRSEASFYAHIPHPITIPKIQSSTVDELLEDGHHIYDIALHLGWPDAYRFYQEY